MVTADRHDLQLGPGRQRTAMYTCCPAAVQLPDAVLLYSLSCGLPLFQ